MQAYFDLVYNPVYDFTTARTTPYRRWQEACLDKLQLADGDRILCVGAGTGNEIIRILKRNNNVRIVAIDASQRALERACKKAGKYGKQIETVKMDAQALDFPAESFDAALCVHLMDFLSDNRKATAEILRVLKKGGQFAVTYPFSEGLKLGVNLAKGSLGCNISSGRYGKAFLELLSGVGAGIVYLPLIFRSKQGFYSYQQLEKMFTALKPEHFQIEEHSGYQDFIVYGRK